jgi:hypothetical protein
MQLEEGMAAADALTPAIQSTADYEVSTGMDRRSRSCRASVLIAVTALQVPIFLAMAKHRIIDGDEGFYLLASRLVFEHKLPYRDFLYLQMPFLPYIYGLWMQIAGYSWLAGRTLSVLLSACLGTLLYAHVRAQTGKWLAGLLAVVLFVSSPDILGWLTTVKTYTLSCLLLFGAYMILSRKRLSIRATCVAGFLLGVGIDTRLFVVAAAPLFLYWLRFHPRAIRYFLLGLAIALSPNIYFFASDPQAYWFGNLGYHAIRSGTGLIGDFNQKLHILSQILGDFELCWLLIVALALRLQSQTSKRSCFLALLLLSVSILPTPAYLQYFCIAIPFLIVAAVCAVSETIENRPECQVKRQRPVTLGYAGSTLHRSVRLERPVQPVHAGIPWNAKELEMGNGRACYQGHRPIRTKWRACSHFLVGLPVRIEGRGLSGCGKPQRVSLRPSS